MNPTVKAVANKTDAELIIKDKTKAKPESISPHSMKKLINEKLLDLTFISKTNRPIYIQIKSTPGNGDVGDKDNQLEVVVGEPEGADDI